MYCKLNMKYATFRSYLSIANGLLHRYIALVTSNVEAALAICRPLEKVNRNTFLRVHNLKKIEKRCTYYDRCIGYCIMDNRMTALIGINNIEHWRFTCPGAN